MTKTEELTLAKNIAADVHKNHNLPDKTTPLTLHLQVVSSLFDSHIKTQLKSIAWLQLVIAKKKHTEASLIKLGISETVAYQVGILTQKKEQSYADYLANIKSEPKAKLVKIADNLAKLSTNITPQLYQKFAQEIILLNTKTAPLSRAA